MQMKSKICPVCNSPVEPHDTICKQCGAILDKEDSVVSIKEDEKENKSDAANRIVKPEGSVSVSGNRKASIAPPPWPSIKDKPEVIYYVPPEKGFFGYIIYGLRSG